MLNKLKKQFQDPGKEFSLIPFWFLNGELDEKGISEKLMDFKSKGIDGFVLHPRMGLPEELEYLGERFMALAEYIVKEAARLDMKVVLYDEGMYPSGSANGLVVKSNPDYAARGLRMEINHVRLNEGEEIVKAFSAKVSDGNRLDFESVCEIDPDSIKTDAKADERSVIYLISTFSKGTIRGIHFGEDDGEENAPPASDILNEEVVSAFINCTHETYYRVLKKYFGNTIIAFFTDEPDVLGRCVDKAKIKPWTDGFLEFFTNRGNKPADLLAQWFDIGEDTAEKNKSFKIAAAKKLELSYYKPLSDWCQSHEIALTGHPAESDDIGLLRYFQIPGQDVVWRWVAPENNKGIEGHDSTMAKCSSDAARHSNKRRNANECFGCCGPDGIQWAFSADDMKWFMDWLFIRGVNLLYPHAFLYSVEGELRKNERPPDVGPNNLWWKHYKIFSDYAKRMSWLMTDSVNHADIAVLCEENHLPWHSTKPLQQNQLEFNYLERNLISDVCEIKDGKLTIQNQAYSILLIEEPQNISNEIADKLHSFIHSGGKVLIYDPNGSFVNNLGAVVIPDFDEVIQAVNTISKPEIIFQNPNLRTSHILKSGLDFYVFVNEGEENLCGEAAILNTGYFEIWDPMTGGFSAISSAQTADGYTHFYLELERRQALIVCADRSILTAGNVTSGKLLSKSIPLDSPWTFHFPNGQEKTINSLESWTNYTEMEHYSGEAVYTTTIRIDEFSTFQKLTIDFGHVCEIAQLFIDGEDAGVKMWAPYVFDVTKFVKKNCIHIKLIVTNSIANRLSGTVKSSGLLGPVKINSSVQNAAVQKL